MQTTLTLHEDAWIRQGPVYGSGQIVGYRVGGLTDGTGARIANFGAPNRNEWRVMRIYADNRQSDWSAPFDSVEDALASLVNDSTPKM